MIQITEENVKAAFKIAGQDVKEVLNALFGLKSSPKHYTDIKTFEDACLVINVPKEQLTFLTLETSDQDLIAAKSLLKLTIAARAMNFLENKGKIWYPDWSNDNEYKYYPWMRYNSGSGFSCTGYVCAYTDASVGSRLVLMTSEMAEYLAKTFTADYNNLFTLQNINNNEQH